MAQIRRFFSPAEAAASAEADEAANLDADPLEEFQKIQRGLRRLSLASDRSGEILQTVSARLDEMHQMMLKKMNRPAQTALAVEEVELLRIVDQLDHATNVPDLPSSARTSIDSARSALLAAARWQIVARIGARPDGADIRIAEFAGDADGKDPADARIHRILQQGYRRMDGTLLRPGVVIAANALRDPSLTR